MTDTEPKQTNSDSPAADGATAAGATAPAGANTEAVVTASVFTSASATAAGEPGPETAPPPAEAELARLREENAKLRDQLLRTLADMENARRRAEREKEDTAKFAISRFAKDLLEVADNLSRALAAVPQSAREADDALNQLAVGVELTEKQLAAAFDRHGLQRLDPVDQKFDPNYHQAMFEVPNSGKPPGTVVQVMQPGYVLQGRLLRPALVGVAKGEPPQKVDTLA